MKDNTDDCGGGGGGGGWKKEVVSDVTITIEADDDNKGDYIKLIPGSDECLPLTAVEMVEECSLPSRRSVVWYWVKMVLLFLSLGFLAVAVLKWVGPYLIDKEVIPIINWETETFSPPVLTILLFASVAIFPTILLPSTPSMWVAGVTLGYGFGFLLIITAAAIGVSLPFIIGSIFHHKIEGWLEKYPKKASILKSAGAGNWFHQFRAVALIRISPFPYMVFNYCAVATNVKYGPYIIGSLVGMVPEIFVAIYTGILIKTLADASNERQSLSAQQIILNALGFCLTVVTTVIITVYAKRRLKELQEEDKMLLLQ
ncbi:putative SNARE associated golgi family protein [Medicago truncatula]|uniref:Putative SNARE associated golgi family protein n=1 Tax=Medicago truncatula TaxID=3880 RepID=G7JK69_MEDTR|nr:transmembrane protein 64 [Medicago truncatula]AES90981.1 SNARE associated family protein [Medicago truncatula]RHN63290.1 putative SNARE associated golgi family protein [Medicago truncatula]